MDILTDKQTYKQKGLHLIQKILLLSLLLLLNSCSLESILALGEVDKVEVVRQNATVSQYRAYFQRTHLEPIKNKQKYLYFYNKKKKDLAILLRYRTHYTLYSLFHPKSSKLIIHTSKKTPYSRVKRILKKRGYVLTRPRDVATSTRVALRRFKGIKTLMVEVKHYHKLSTSHKKSKQTKEETKKEVKEETKKEVKEENSIPDTLNEQDSIEEEKVNLALAEEDPEPYKETPVVATSYNYYAEESSYEELAHYLSNEETKNALSFNQYRELSQRLAKLKEQKLLKDGSLEELISAYKINKKPQYKHRIMVLMKEAQKK